MAFEVRETASAAVCPEAMGEFAKLGRGASGTWVHSLLTPLSLRTCPSSCKFQLRKQNPETGLRDNKRQT